MPIPYVIERTHHGERSYDIYSRLLKDRIIFLSGEINDPLANAIIAQLLFLQAEDSEKDVQIYVNSPGGSITSGLAIYDTIQYIAPKVQTFCVGMAASMAAVLLAAGEKGKRFTLPNSRIMIHQPLGGVQGQATDIAIHAKEIQRLKTLLTEILANHTGQTKAKVTKDTERDYYMNGQDALTYGIVDNIVHRPPQISN